ncbi:hypothetical protein ACQLT9_005821 [Salmonella enterica subsp. diarizonae]
MNQPKISQAALMRGLFYIRRKNMKLSPEATQAIKTAIEQLRLLLVDDAMDTIRESASKHWMDAGKEFVTPVIKSASISNGGQSAGLIQAEKRPDNEAQDSINLKRIKETFLQLACEVIAKERA